MTLEKSASGLSRQKLTRQSLAPQIHSPAPSQHTDNFKTMNHQKKRRTAALLLCAVGLVSVASAAPDSGSTDALALVAKQKGVFTRPPQRVPSRMHPHDAPILGNGDLVTAFAGNSEYPQFWLTSNDFWEFRSPDQGGAPKPLGRVVFETPSMADASYHVEQDFATATTMARFEKNGNALLMKAWVAATENLLLVELSAEKSPIDVQLSFHFPGDEALGADKVHESNPPNIYKRGTNEPAPVEETGWTNNVLWAQRTFDKNVFQPTRLAMAARVLDMPANDGKFTITPGKPVLVAIAVRSWFKTTQPLENAQRRVQRFTADDEGLLRQMHLAWWKKYWEKGGVTLGDPQLEMSYYRSLYHIASLSRDPEFPTHFDGVVTTDNPLWCSDYHLDYNEEQTYLGWATTGRFEQADPYVAPFLAQAEIVDKTDPKKWPTLSRNQSFERITKDPQFLANHPHYFEQYPDGWRLPMALGPKGYIATAGFYCMKSQSALAVTPVGDRWYRSYDDAYAAKVYPFVRGVARFFEHDFVLENGHYVLLDDAFEEDGFFPDTPCRNNIAGLAVIRSTLKLALDMSESLGLDAELRPKWREILDKLSPYPIKPVNKIMWRELVRHPKPENPQLAPVPMGPLVPPEFGDRKVFCTEEVGNEWFSGFAGSMYAAYPCGNLGLDSDPQVLEAARNTITLRTFLESGEGRKWQKEHNVPGPYGRGAWGDNNGGPLFFGGAIRVGYDPEIIWKNLTQIARGASPNGCIWQGVESWMFVPNTIQEMMLQSHENVLRFFRCWPKKSEPNASFRDFWAYGAFRCSAALKDGVVADVRIVSEKGRPCVVENPWPGKKVLLSRNGKSAETLDGDRLKFETAPGETILLTPQP